MSIDVSNFTAVTMYKRPKFTGTRYYDGDILMAKTCSRCHEVRYVEEFAISSKSSDGLASMCKPCKKIARASYYAKPKRKPRTRIKGTPERAKRLRKIREDKLRNRSPEEIVEKQKELRPLGIKSCGYCKIYFPLSNFNSAKRNYDGLSRYCKKCHSYSVRRNYNKRLIEFWNSKNIPLECYICGGEYQEKEHVVPLSLLGADEFHNLLPVCVECNRGESGKHDKLLYEWLIEKYSLDYANTIIDKVLTFGVNPYVNFSLPIR